MICFRLRGPVDAVELLLPVGEWPSLLTPHEAYGRHDANALGFPDSHSKRSSPVSSPHAMALRLDLPAPPTSISASCSMRRTTACFTVLP